MLHNRTVKAQNESPKIGTHANNINIIILKLNEAYLRNNPKSSTNRAIQRRIFWVITKICDRVWSFVTFEQIFRWKYAKVILTFRNFSNIFLKISTGSWWNLFCYDAEEITFQFVYRLDDNIDALTIIDSTTSVKTEINDVEILLKKRNKWGWGRGGGWRGKG